MLLTGLPLFRAGAVSLTGSFLTRVSSTSNSTSYSFSSYGFGTAAGDRWIALVVHNACNGTASSDADIIPTAVSIGGVTAALVAAPSGSTAGGGQRGTSIWIAAVPTGTSGTIAVTYGQTQANCVVDGFRITGSATVTVDGAAQVNVAITQTVATSALSVVAGSVQLAGVGCNGSDTYSWSGLTEAADAAVESSGYSAALLNSATAGSVSPSVTASSNDGALKALVAVSLKG